MTFLLGIDGGGTGCRAALATAAGDIIGRGKSGAANIRTDLTGARENIRGGGAAGLSPKPARMRR